MAELVNENVYRVTHFLGYIWMHEICHKITQKKLDVTKHWSQ
jgi:hypothetical protein